MTWTYSVEASALEFLAPGQSKVESFTIRLSDGQGGSVQRTVSVTLTGSNDGPVLNELNTFPGFTARSQVPRMAAAVGIDEPLLFYREPRQPPLGAGGSQHAAKGVHSRSPRLELRVEVNRAPPSGSARPAPG